MIGYMTSTVSILYIQVVILKDWIRWIRCVISNVYFYNDAISYLKRVEYGENVAAYNSREKSKYPGHPQQRD